MPEVVFITLGRLAAQPRKEGFDIERRTNRRRVDTICRREGVIVPAFWIDLHNPVVQVPYDERRVKISRWVRGRLALERYSSPKGTRGLVPVRESDRAICRRPRGG